MRIHLPVLVALLALTWSSTAQSQQLVRGVVTRVDLNGKQLHVETRGLRLRRVPLVLATNEKTTVTVGLKPGTLEDLAVGARVRVVVMQDVALSIRTIGLLSKRPTPTPAEPAAPKIASPKNGVSGELRRVSWYEREIILIGPGADGAKTETIVQVPKDARVIQHGKKIPFDELKDGSQAFVETLSNDGKQVAKSIQIGDAPAPAKESGTNQILRYYALVKLIARYVKLFNQTPEK